MAKIAQTVASYFQSNALHLNIWAGQGTAGGLRKCQLGAYWAVWSHFTTSDQPALISLPTGSGKTALMMTLAFGLAAKRILVVTPAQVLRDQTTDQFASLEVLKRTGVVDQSISLPKVTASLSQCSTQADWKKFEAFDVVVATPKTTSPAEKNVCSPPDTLFDLVFFDEAHHTPAPTWTALVRAFSKSQIVFLTATPFRRDRARIRAPLVYYYSIGRALDDGIYRPIDFHKVSHDASRTKQDELLCKAAVKVFKTERKAGNHAKLLIRTNSTNWSDRLVSLYQGQGLKVEAVDYTKSWSENRLNIEAIRQGKLDGMVCVGMVGEGLDIPDLKIAVLHSSPRSLPYTLQFVGRVSRTTSSQTGNAHLLAVPDEVRGEVRQLYRSDANWRRMVPKLVDAVVGKVTALKHFRSVDIADAIDIDPHDLKPFFSVRVYSVSNVSKVMLAKDVDLSDDLSLCFQETVLGGSVLIVIAEQEHQPSWAKETAIPDPTLSLHVYYFDSGNRLFFESTTSESVSKEIRQQLAPDVLDPLTPAHLMQVMQGTSTSDYFMVGLRNAIGKGVSQPTYKTVMGSQVQAAVRPSEGKTFAPGHVLAKVASDETRGIATGRSRIWAIRRDSIREFQSWCDELAVLLKSQKVASQGLPQLAFLARPEQISKIPKRPLAVILDDRLLVAKRLFEITDQTNTVITSTDVPQLDVESFSKGVVECSLQCDSGAAPLPMSFDVSGKPQWQVGSIKASRVRLEFSSDAIFDSTMGDFLERFPPSFVMPDGGMVTGSTYWRPMTPTSAIPLDCLIPYSWTGCEITNEDRVVSSNGMMNVQDFLQTQLSRTLPKGSLLIKDHGSYEIADFIQIDGQSKRISLFHCKKSGDKKPGSRVDDCYDVLGQSCRSRIWIRSPELIKELKRRVDATTRSTAIVVGTMATLASMANSFSSNAWTYEVVAVQPGIDTSKVNKAQSNNHVNSLLAATFEWLAAAEASFVLWGS